MNFHTIEFNNGLEPVAGRRCFGKNKTLPDGKNRFAAAEEN
jgi:hypothetical protein